MANLEHGFFRIFTIILWSGSVLVSLASSANEEYMIEMFMEVMFWCIGGGYGSYYLLRAVIRWISAGFRR